MEFIWSVSSAEAPTHECQRITQRRAQIVGNNTVLHKVDERYLKPGFRAPTWSPDAGSGRPCAPLGSWAPVRRVEGTAGRGRTGRARRGPMGRAWQGRRSGGRRRRAERLRIIKNIYIIIIITPAMNFSTFESLEEDPLFPLARGTGGSAQHPSASAAPLFRCFPGCR